MSSHSKILCGLLGVLLILAVAPVALPARAAGPTQLDVAAVFTHPVQSLSDFNNVFPTYYIYQSGMGMGLMEAYPFVYYAFNNTYVPALMQGCQTIAQNNTYICHL